MQVIHNQRISINFYFDYSFQLIYLLRFVKKGYTPFDIAALIEPTFWIFISVGKYISHYTAALYFDMLVSLSSV